MSNSPSNGVPNFDIVEEEHHFTLRGQTYVLREPHEAANLKHRKTQFRNAKVRDDKVQYDLDDAAEAASVLVGESVYRAGEDKPIGQHVILGKGGEHPWPHRLVRLLYEKAREMSGADTAESIDAQIAKLQEMKEKAADPKKPQPSTTTD